MAAGGAGEFISLMAALQTVSDRSAILIQKRKYRIQIPLAQNQK